MDHASNGYGIASRTRRLAGFLLALMGAWWLHASTAWAAGSEEALRLLSNDRWKFTWRPVWEMLIQQEQLLRVGISVVLVFTLGVQLLLFPLFYWVLRFHPSSAMRLAYFMGVAIFLGLFIWIYFHIFWLTWPNYWFIILGFVVLSLMILWVVTMPKKQLA